MHTTSEQKRKARKAVRKLNQAYKFVELLQREGSSAPGLSNYERVLAGIETARVALRHV